MTECFPARGAFVTLLEIGDEEHKGSGFVLVGRRRPEKAG